jgi:replicative DNA helicase
MTAAAIERLRVPPQSIEAEQSVLGGLLVDNQAFDSAADLLSEADFYSYDHRLIYAATRRIIAAGKPADVVTVYQHLQANGQDERSGGLTYLNALAQSVPSAANLRRYAEIVRDRSVLRQLIRLADEVAAAAYGNGADAGRIIDGGITQLMALQQGAAQAEPRLLAEILPEVVDEINAHAEGHTNALPTGLRRLDDITCGGMRPGELWVIGARPSMGKTAISLTLSRLMAGGRAVLVLTQEDSERSTAMRHIAAAGRVNLSALRDPARAPSDMWGKLLGACDELQTLRMYIDDQASLTLADVRRKVQQVRRRDAGLRVVVVDYLQLMDGEGDNRSQELGALANGLKRMAKEFGLTVLLLSQLNREADKRNGVPQMGDLRESGDIEGAADVVALLHREFRRTGKPHQKHWAQLHVAKQKNGPTDTISLYFDGETQRFSDWDGPPPREGDEYGPE